MNDLLNEALEILEEYKPVWIVGKCQCSVCEYTYIGVIHKNRTFNLECPNCGNYTSEVIQNF